MALHVDSEQHFALAYRYLQVLAIELRAALLRHGVRNPAVQEEILKSFLFGLAVGWDGGAIEDSDARGGAWHPTPCFRDSNEIGEAGRLVVPDGDDAFHELAVFGAIEDAMSPGNPERDWSFTYDGVAGSQLIQSLLEDES